MNTNPLLQKFTTVHQTPPFDKIKTEHYLPAFKESLVKARQDIAKIVDSKEKPSFENTVLALEYAGKQLDDVASIFFNINSAETNDEIQAIAREVSPMLTEYSNDIVLNETLFDRIKTVYDSREGLNLNAEQLKLLEDSYKGFERKGALLTGEDRERYRAITTELSKLTLHFGENVLAETNAFKLHITDPADLSGLPDAIKTAAAELARREEKEGWIFTLQFPSYVPFMKYADNRALRKQMYMAYASRASKGDEHDNKAIIAKIVNLRLEKAKLLGYQNHAEFVLEERMAKTPTKVNDFLNDLLNRSIEFARQDVADVAEFAKKDGLKDTLQRWDFSYYSEKLKTEKFDFTEEETKPYFPLDKVIDGVLGLANRLYGISFIENKDIPVYHNEVKAYEVLDENGSHLSVLYLDFFPRKGKQGGAWMTTYGDQYIKDGKNIRPLVSLVCNFSRPTQETPSLLTHNEVTTFLHEFGHGLHGMLANTTYKSHSGTSVYRDFVELPSQILENWGNEKEWLQMVGQHYKTGEVIPDELVDKILASANFQSGYLTVRQLSFGLNDMAWHTIMAPFEGSVSSFENAAMAKTELFPEVEGTSFSPAFSHIFAGGYAAGYYGYKWAEVLDADAFSLFKQNGIFDKATAASFRKNILSKGGTEHPMELYVAFRGQEPTLDALMERSGLVK
ncbi:peptidyl-dipeptidase Dcp [Saccharicrinis carchari]|uniref:Peptidyl-dipeptidase Dcp n=1 Tax=Saccharicrinis carchari TaxID=1168039 RepID=A0A521AE82_SACCC|nr:M3 family metallopeptidase [Saccharicrinis carchari]SMO33124.1 peptidyl-dipeptidase Dcp [Saccharicrinis carchari]